MTDGPQTTHGRVRLIDGRIYVTLGGVEHGLDDAEAERLLLALAERMPSRFMVVARDEIQTPFASTLGGEEAKERLRQINVLSYRGTVHAR